ncbi:MAG: hypothetical protein ACJAS3_002449, partial [Roseivirga sp.]
MMTLGSVLNQINQTNYEETIIKMGCGNDDFHNHFR